jgi:hypothetical protein
MGQPYFYLKKLKLKSLESEGSTTQSKPSMSFFVQSIVKKSKDIEKEEVEMIFRNMVGEVPQRVVVLKTAFFTDVRAYCLPNKWD